MRQDQEDQRPETRIVPTSPNVRWTAEIILELTLAETSISPSSGASLRAHCDLVRTTHYAAWFAKRELRHEAD